MWGRCGEVYPGETSHDTANVVFPDRAMRDSTLLTLAFPTHDIHLAHHDLPPSILYTGRRRGRLIDWWSCAHVRSKPWNIGASIIQTLGILNVCQKRFGLWSDVFEYKVLQDVRDQ